MPSVDKVQGPASYFPAIEKKYGQPITHWMAVLQQAGPLKHMDLVGHLKQQHAMGHGHANALVAWFKRQAPAPLDGPAMTPAADTAAAAPEAAPSLHGACHCGAVRLLLPAMPSTATACNCSVCRRVNGLWAYYPLGTVQVQGHPGHTEAYVWGDKTLRTLRCKTCGVVTHWEPLVPEPGARHGVNLRNFDPALVRSVTVRHFDGADSGTFLD